ncbi:MAG: hypothetical protein AABX79_01890 [Nanoarchaeota archaeon]
MGNAVLNLSKEVVRWLGPYCRRIEIVGSIRRKQQSPKDVDVVLIPKSHSAKGKMENFLESKGRKTLGGEKKAYFRIKGIDVELYYTVPEEWGAALLAYSSRRGSGIGLRIVARLNGFKLSQHGLFSLKTGKRVAGRTEREIYHALGRPWKSPEKR